MRSKFKEIFRSLVQIQLSGCRTVFCCQFKKNNRSYREEASSGYKHVHKTDSTDSSAGRAQDCSVRSKFDSNPQVAGSNPAQWIQYCFFLNT